MAGLALFGGLLLDSAATSAQARPVRIIAFGDSLTAGYMLPAQAAFPNALERALRAAGDDVEVVNAGVSGDTASGGLERLDWALGDGADAMIVELGANDMLRGLDPEITYKALREIIVRTQRKGVKVLLAGMLASPGLGRDYVERFNAIYPRLARETGVLLHPFFLAGVVGNRALLLGDGIHPTAAGVDVIVKGILPKARELVRSISIKP